MKRAFDLGCPTNALGSIALQASVFDRLSTHFDAIIRLTVAPTDPGRVSLDGKGLKLGVRFGGERSTPAIESLKIIAFDLAVLCMG